MKKAFLTLISIIASYCTYSQTNTFPASGNVGVGTISPGAKLDIANIISGVHSTNPTLFRILDGYNSGNNGQYFQIIGDGDGTNYTNINLISNWGYLSFGARADNATTPANFLNILPSGNIGIGTTAPTYLLSVGGNATTMTGGQSSVQYYPTVTSGNYAGFVSQIVANPSSASTATYYGSWGEAGDNSTVTTNFNLLIGSGGSLVHRGTGIVASVVSLYAGSPTVSGGGSITTAYGLFVNSIKGTGITNSFGIYQSSVNDKNFFAGNVAIGTTNPQGYMLAVNGSAIATSMFVKLYANWPDYVFKKDYQLPSLQEVETYIDQNHRLPEMPSEDQIKKDGLNLGEMNKLLAKKVEELTLYLIEKDKQEKEQEKINLENKNRIDKLEQELNALLKQK